MAQAQQSRRRKPVLWAAGIVVALAFAFIVICGYLFGWKWTGLLKKTLWDWLDLLIVPVVLAIGGYLFTRSENRRTQKIADQERTLDREIADARRQDDTLQAYLEGMAQLLTDREQPLHRAQQGDSLSTLARARTLTVLGRVDSIRKRSVMQFLFESGLIYKGHTLLNGSDLIERRHNIVSLQQADLSSADLYDTNLAGADLRGADLDDADLFRANLAGADLSTAQLYDANLACADLRGAILYGAIMQGANLREANLFGANLVGADLLGADLTGAIGITNEELELQANTHEWSLEGTTMPNGQKYEDWLKGKEGRAEDRKNGSSL